MNEEDMLASPVALEEEELRQRLATLEASEARFRAVLRHSARHPRKARTGRPPAIAEEPRDARPPLERDNAELRRLEEERAQLEAQLRAAQKMESLGSLVGGIAHDFNNLLGVILACSELVLDAMPDTDPVREEVLEIRSASTRGAALVRQLLAFGRKELLQPITLDVNHAVLELDKILRRVIGEDITLVTVLASELERVVADPGQLEQVIMNLVANARDAMPEGGTLTLQTANVVLDEEETGRRGLQIAVKPGAYVELAVTDSGAGMAPATRARLFEPFFTTKPKGKGTGLGLSTVHGILKQAGGSISVHSELGKGTRVCIFLPRTESLYAAGARLSAILPAAGGSETILLVEDEAPLRAGLRRILCAAGYSVLCASNGAEALQLCREHRGDIALVLTDAVMPHTSARQLAIELVALRPDIKLLFMSGYGAETLERQGVGDESTRFMQKPFGATELTAKIRELLDGGGRDTLVDPIEAAGFS